MIKILNIIILIGLLFLGEHLLAQTSVINYTIILKSKEGTVQEILDEIESNSNIIFSFDPGKVLVHRTVKLRSNEYVILDLLDQLFIGQQLHFKSIRNKILILPIHINYIELTGYIYNANSKEVLTSALIVDELSNQSTYSDERGYYRIKLIEGAVDISVYYLGNIRVNSKNNLNNNTSLNFHLPLDYNLDSVVILTNRADPYINYINSGDLIIDYIRSTYKGKLGQKEVFENVRMMSGIQSGNEAQGGFYVRGGTPDQNLILMDGIPLYNSSHIGGLSSIFMDDMILDATLIKSGYPARYGGRLSSVLDIKLKEGNYYKTNIAFDLGLDAFHMHMDGPLIKDHLSFNFSLRKSLLNYTVGPLLAYERSYDGLDLNYYDTNLKLTYKINDKHKLSFLSYNGRDHIGIFRDSIKSDIIDQSKIAWENLIIGFNYQYKISNKMFMELYINTTQYEQYSRGQYKFDLNNPDKVPIELDVLVYSGIKDHNLKVEFDYQPHKHHTLRYGMNMTFHQYIPIIHKSKEIIDGKVTKVLKEAKKIKSKEQYIYLEDDFSIDDKLDIYAGLHWSSYQIKDKNYNFLQPRLSIKWHPIKQLTVSLTGTKMVQNIHFMPNPGLGLPSELWIPTTEKIAPQTVNQYGMGLSYFTKDLWRIGLDYYKKEYKGILEYDNPNDLFYAFILSNSSIGSIGFEDWEKHIETGKSEVNSFEIYISKKWNKLDFWSSYNWSHHLKFFDHINNGKPFLSKFDRTHDINIKTSYEINQNWSVSGSWTYGSGNTLSLPIEEYPLLDSLGTVSVSSDRNNLRLPAFHHLDMSTSYQRVFEKMKINLNFGVYNVYNRLNPFYVYLYEDKKTRKIKLSQLSLYPILPFANIKFVF